MSVVWISHHWIWTNLYEQKIASHRILHSSYWSQWKNPAILQSILGSEVLPNCIYCPVITMWLCCAVSYTISYLVLCLAVSHTSLFRELSISPVINTDMSVQYQLKFRLVAFTAHAIQKEDMASKTTYLKSI